MGIASPVGRTPGALGSFRWEHCEGADVPRAPPGGSPPHQPPLSRTAKPATDLLALSMSSSSSHGAPSGLRRGLLERACREQTTVSDSFLRLEAAGAGRANGPRALGTPRTEDGGSRGAGRVWGRAPWSPGLPLPVSGRPAYDRFELKAEKSGVLFSKSIIGRRACFWGGGRGGWGPGFQGTRRDRAQSPQRGAERPGRDFVNGSLSG